MTATVAVSSIEGQERWVWSSRWKQWTFKAPTINFKGTCQISAQIMPEASHPLPLPRGRLLPLPKSGIKIAPLLCRAWTLQERILDPRVLYFHDEELVWECHTTIAYECGFLQALPDIISYKSEQASIIKNEGPTRSSV